MIPQPEEPNVTGLKLSIAERAMHLAAVNLAAALEMVKQCHSMAMPGSVLQRDLASTYQHISASQTWIGTQMCDFFAAEALLKPENQAQAVLPSPEADEPAPALLH